MATSSSPRIAWWRDRPMHRPHRKTRRTTGRAQKWGMETRKNPPPTYVRQANEQETACRCGVAMLLCVCLAEPTTQVNTKNKNNLLSPQTRQKPLLVVTNPGGQKTLEPLCQPTKARGIRKSVAAPRHTKKNTKNKTREPQNPKRTAQRRNENSETQRAKRRPKKRNENFCRPRQNAAKIWEKTAPKNKRKTTFPLRGQTTNRVLWKSEPHFILTKGEKEGKERRENLHVERATIGTRPISWKENKSLTTSFGMTKHHKKPPNNPKTQSVQNGRKGLWDTPISLGGWLGEKGTEKSQGTSPPLQPPKPRIQTLDMNLSKPPRHMSHLLAGRAKHFPDWYIGRTKTWQRTCTLKSQKTLHLSKQKRRYRGPPWGGNALSAPKSHYRNR